MERRDLSTSSCDQGKPIRLTSSFDSSPEVTLETYLRPYVQSARFSGFGELKQERTFDFDFYGVDEGELNDLGAGLYEVSFGDEEPTSFRFYRPDFTYTKNLRYQNLHGMDLHGQSAICLPCFGPRVAFFPNRSRGPTSNRRLFHFLNFLKFYSCQLCFCLCLPVSHFFQNERRGPTSNRRVLQFL